MKLDYDKGIQDGGFHFWRESQPGLKAFTYRRTFTPTGDSGTTTIYCEREFDFIRLLERWNTLGREKWVYSIENNT